ncbi:MDIS1-interacting receptor like kinase 2-like protein [Tanacetum coccineum]
MKVTEKCDVYSFGVLVLEIIKGEHPGDMVAYLTSPMTEKVELKDLVDHRLPVPLLGMKKVLTSILILAIKCVNGNPKLRPTMNDVSHKIIVICDMPESDNIVDIMVRLASVVYVISTSVAKEKK